MNVGKFLSTIKWKTIQNLKHSTSVLFNLFIKVIKINWLLQRKKLSKNVWLEKPKFKNVNQVNKGIQITQMPIKLRSLGMNHSKSLSHILNKNNFKLVPDGKNQSIMKVKNLKDFLQESWKKNSKLKRIQERTTNEKWSGNLDKKEVLYLIEPKGSNNKAQRVRLLMKI